MGSTHVFDVNAYEESYMNLACENKTKILLKNIVFVIRVEDVSIGSVSVI